MEEKAARGLPGHTVLGVLLLVISGALLAVDLGLTETVPAGDRSLMESARSEDASNLHTALVTTAAPQSITSPCNLCEASQSRPVLRDPDAHNVSAHAAAANVFRVTNGHARATTVVPHPLSLGATTHVSPSPPGPRRSAVLHQERQTHALVAPTSASPASASLTTALPASALPASASRGSASPASALPTSANSPYAAFRSAPAQRFETETGGRFVVEAPQIMTQLPFTGLAPVKFAQTGTPQPAHPLVARDDVQGAQYYVVQMAKAQIRGLRSISALARKKGRDRLVVRMIAHTRAGTLYEFDVVRHNGIGFALRGGDSPAGVGFGRPPMTEIPTVLRIVSAFAVVALVLYAFALISRQRLGTRLLARGDRLVSVIETTPLAQNASLHVVKLGERYHVIALASGAVSLLTEIEPPVVERFAATRKAPALLGINTRTKSDDRRESARADLS
jgi:flagellar biogenesis protein FliO